MTSMRTGAVLSLGLALAGCGEPVIEWQHVQSPDHRIVATAAYDAPVLDRNDTYVFLESPRWFSRQAVYRSHGHDCVVLRWAGPRALTIEHLSGLPKLMIPEWKPRWGGEMVRITYRNLEISGLKLPPECMVMR